MNAFGRLMVKLGATPPPDSDFWYKPVNGSKWFVSTDSAMRITEVGRRADVLVIVDV